MNEMISFGAGVNSVAMVIMLVGQGWRGPIVFADPGNEMPETYCYNEYFEREFLKPHGLEVKKVSPVNQPHLYDKRIAALPTLEKFCLDQGVVPFLAVRWCSVQFKGKPLESWAVENQVHRTLLGFCIDEPQRVHYGDESKGYPLVEESINRAECQRIIQRAGLEVPRKSGCFFCPGQSLGQWRALYYEHPDLYERAIKLEENASERHQKSVTLNPSGVNLWQMAQQRWEGQEQMDLSRWLPCLCAL